MQLAASEAAGQAFLVLQALLPSHSCMEGAGILCGCRVGETGEKGRWRGEGQCGLGRGGWRSGKHLSKSTTATAGRLCRCLASQSALMIPEPGVAGLVTVFRSPNSLDEAPGSATPNNTTRQNSQSEFRAVIHFHCNEI